MSEESGQSPHLDRRDFLKTAGVMTAGAAIGAQLGTMTGTLTGAVTQGAAPQVIAPTRAVQPFRLSQVTLGEGLFREKRDRMLNYARNYGGTDVFAGPDRMLRNFRANAGLDTKGAQPPGSWENATGYLRGHYAGHFMSMLAQAYAGTRRRDLQAEARLHRGCAWRVPGRARCRGAQDRRPRHGQVRTGAAAHGFAARRGRARLASRGHRERPERFHDRDVDQSVGLRAEKRSRTQSQEPIRRRSTTAQRYSISAIPNPEFAAPPQAHMFLTVRVSNDSPVPRFAITTTGNDGEQRIDGSVPAARRSMDAHRGHARAETSARCTSTAQSQARTPHDAAARRPRCHEGQLDRPMSVPAAQRVVSQCGRRRVPDLRPRAQPAEVQSLTTSPGGSAGGGNVAWYRFDETGGREAARRVRREPPRDRSSRPTDGRRHPGFLSAYPETQFMRLEEFATYGGNQGIWAPYYTLHKILAGLLDAHLLAGNAQALEIAAKIGDWVHSRLAPLRQEQLDRMWNTYIAGEYGGINDSLAQLHSLRPGRPEYLAAARRFDNTASTTPMVRERGHPRRPARQPAHSAVHRLPADVRAEQRAALLRRGRRISGTWSCRTASTATAAWASARYSGARGVIAGSLYQNPKDNNHAETCPLYNMLKLSRNLFFHDPDPEVHELLRAGAVQPDPGLSPRRRQRRQPEVTYFVPVRPGQRRTYGNVGTCCGGTGMENHTKYQDSIYFRSVDDSALYVNLYADSDAALAGEEVSRSRRRRNTRAEGESTNHRGWQRAARHQAARAGLGAKGLYRSDQWHRSGRRGGFREPTSRSTGNGGRATRIEIAMPFRFRVERALDQSCRPVDLLRSDSPGRAGRRRGQRAWSPD